MRHATALRKVETLGDVANIDERKAKVSRERLYRALREARTLEGRERPSIRELAKASGLSPTRVQQIVEGES